MNPIPVASRLIEVRIKASRVLSLAKAVRPKFKVSPGDSFNDLIIFFFSDLLRSITLPGSAGTENYKGLIFA